MHEGQQVLAQCKKFPARCMCKLRLSVLDRIFAARASTKWVYALAPRPTKPVMYCENAQQEQEQARCLPNGPWHVRLAMAPPPMLPLWAPHPLDSHELLPLQDCTPWKSRCQIAGARHRRPPSSPAPAPRQRSGRQPRGAASRGAQRPAACAGTTRARRAHLCAAAAGNPRQPELRRAAAGGGRRSGRAAALEAEQLLV